jgi:TRAP-type mannitol/chloroaromatic compound transport system substrate-binding protein
VIDASNWGSPDGFKAVKLHEVAKFYLGPSLIKFDMEDQFMNMRAYNSLPDDLKTVMNLATRVYAVERAATSTYNSAVAVGEMKAAGVEFSALPPEDVEEMKRISSEALDRMAGDDPGTQEVLKIIFETRDQLNERPSNI